jgi:hypothetical protein
VGSQPFPLHKKGGEPTHGGLSCLQARPCSQASPWVVDLSPISLPLWVRSMITRSVESSLVGEEGPLTHTRVRSLRGSSALACKVCARVPQASHGIHPLFVATSMHRPSHMDARVRETATVACMCSLCVVADRLLPHSITTLTSSSLTQASDKGKARAHTRGSKQASRPARRARKDGAAGAR